MNKIPATVFMLLLLINSACFNVREPEKPDSQSEWTQANQPEQLLGNLQQAISTLNLSVYERCFTNTGFNFVADAAVAGTSNNIFAQWGLPEEREYFNAMAKQAISGGRHNLQLSQQNKVFFTADSLELSADYLLTIAHTDTTSAAQNYKGNLRFIMRRQQNEWKITYWQDYKTTAEPCWSEAKKYFIAR